MIYIYIYQSALCIPLDWPPPAPLHPSNNCDLGLTMRFYLSPVKHHKTAQHHRFCSDFWHFLAAFCYQNYRKTINMQTYLVPLGGNVSRYKITLNLTLKCRVVSGR